MRTLAKFEKDFTSDAIGYSALGIILSTCLGAMVILQILQFGYGLLHLALVMVCVAICSMHNAAILTVQKPIVVFKLLVASVILNSLVISVSLFL